MDYVKFYVALLTHRKAEGLSDRAWRALTLSWLYAGQHETAGHLPREARRYVRMTDHVEEELVSRGWMERNGNGWVLNDWEEHQAAGDELAERRRRDRERKAEERRRKKEAEKHGGR